MTSNGPSCGPKYGSWASTEITHTNPKETTLICNFFNVNIYKEFYSGRDVECPHLKKENQKKDKELYVFGLRLNKSNNIILYLMLFTYILW